MNENFIDEYFWDRDASITSSEFRRLIVQAAPISPDLLLNLVQYRRLIGGFVKDDEQKCNPHNESEASDRLAVAILRAGPGPLDKAGKTALGVSQRSS